MKNDKHASILKTAKRLFYRLGIHNVTIDEIARAYGISKKTIYVSFESKSDLVNNVVEQEIFLFHSQLKEITAKAENAVEELKHFFSLLGNFNVPSIVIHDVKKHYPDLYHRLLGMADQTIKTFFDINIQRGMHELMYKENNKPANNIGTVLRILKLVIFDDRSQSADRAADIRVLGDLFINHLVADREISM